MKLRNSGNKSNKSDIRKPAKRDEISINKDDDIGTSKGKEVMLKINEVRQDIENYAMKEKFSNTKHTSKKDEIKQSVISKEKGVLTENTSKTNSNKKVNTLNDKNVVNNSLTNKTKSSNKIKDNKEINIHKDHRSRLKKQYRDNGGSVLTDIQILELLLFFAIPQKDTNPIAHKLINKFGSIRNVLTADIQTLMSVDGIKENSATLISLVNSMFKYISTPETGVCVDSAPKAIEYCRDLFQGEDIEKFYVICLTKTSQVKSVRLIQSGTTDEIQIQIRNITEFALESKCNRIIVAHNHPYGDAVMSDEDCSFTYSLIFSCYLNSIDILDHIIISPNGAFSAAQDSILKHLKNKAVKSISVPVSFLKIISSNAVEYKLFD